MASWLKNISKFFNHEKRSQSKYFYRLIWIGCMSACIPVVLIGGLYYYLATNSLTEQIKSDTQSSLVLFKERVERILQTIELESHQLATNHLIRDSFSTPFFQERLISHREILEQLKVRTLENSFIKEIFYYNYKNDFVLSNEYGYISTDSFRYKEDIEMIMNAKQDVGWLNLPIAGAEGNISYVRKLPILKSGKPQGLLVMQVEKAPFQDYFPTQKHQSSFILDHQNEILFKDNESPLNTLSKNVSALNSIIKSEANHGIFYSKNENGDRLLYTYDGRSTFGRVYISMIPQYAITEQLTWFRWMIVSSIFVFLSIGILLSVYNTKRAYNPIKQLMNYSKSLSKQEVASANEGELSVIKDCLETLNQEKQKLGTLVDQMEPTVREWFFQQILEEKYVLNDNFYRKCEGYHIPIQSIYVVMTINIADFGDTKRFYDEDKPMFFFAIKNIILDLIQNDPSFDEIELNYLQDNLAIVFRFKEEIPSSQIREQLQGFSSNLFDSVQTSLSLAISIGVGGTYSHVSDLSKSYQEALLALQYRIYKDPETVLFLEDFETSKKKGMFFYPREFETRIMESLEVGDLKEAEQTLNEFSKAVSSFESYNSIYQCFHLLLSSIIFSLEKKGKSIIDIFEPDLFGQLKAIQTLDEINKWFMNDLFPLYQSLSDESDMSNGSLAVKQICQFINENISQDITLTQCAEMVNFTPSYLSRLFKKEVGMNFRDYVLMRKVEMAKSLCVETDSKVSEIADAVGYSERNLNRLFQRYVDMTLSQYRNNHR
ncbi:AraC family transcriptional regulator [Halalkalibacter kiskunsagensis]|uniref:AraC family transcriptional regulator n=1 Tax=Halalkalibacter kiskunsagensis TaxID=1548599 RepID=A0ABV6KHH7_9BACI